MRTGGWVMNESAKRAIKSIAFIFVFILLGRPDVVAAESNEKQASFLMRITVCVFVGNITKVKKYDQKESC